MKRLRIFASLFAAIATIIATPSEPVFLMVIGGVLLWALFTRAWFDVLLCLTIGLTLAFTEAPLLAIFGLLAYLGLTLVLLIGPWTRFIPALVPFYTHRRHLGVTVFLIGLGHASFVFSTIFAYNLSTLFSYTLPTLGFTALFIMGAMAATSFDKIQKRLDIFHWQTLHLVLLVIYTAAIAHLFENAGAGFTVFERGVFVAILIYWTLISPLAVPSRLLRFVDGWKQMHILVYAAYAAMLLHVWTARVATDTPFKKAGFFALAAIVVGSHIAGWVIFYLKRQRTPVHQGEGRIRLGASGEFKEGKGALVRTQTEDLAVFRHNGRMFAVANRCPHQGGSLSQGKIENGYVVCPWHGYQFSMEDGKGPPNFGDHVAHYPLIEENDSVFINETSLPKCARPAQGCCRPAPGSAQKTCGRGGPRYS